jgi:hypothetical protein
MHRERVRTAKSRAPRSRGWQGAIEERQKFSALLKLLRAGLM